MPWKRAATTEHLREVHALQMALLNLRQQLSRKQTYAERLEYLLHQRLETIEQLQGTVDSLRLKNRLLGQENGHLAAMLAPK